MVGRDPPQGEVKVSYMEDEMKKLTFLLIVTLMVVSMLPVVSAQETPTLLIWADETRASVINDNVAAFEEAAGVDVEVQQVDFGAIRDQLKVAGPAGEGPDIIIGAHDWLGELVVNGLVAEVDLGDDAANFLPAAINAFTYEGKLYGVPYAVENIALFYNTDLVAEPPKTWDEVIAMSKEIMESGAAEYGFIRQEGDPYHFYPIQTAFGGYVFGTNEDGSYNPEDVGIDNEGSIEALNLVVSMINDGLFPAGLDGDTAQTLFADGQAAMYITGPWNISNFETAGVPFAIAPVPGKTADSPGGPFLGVQGFMVSAFSENPLLAQAFLTSFAATEEVQIALSEAGGRPPARIVEGLDNPYFDALAAAAGSGQAMPAIPEMGAVWSAWGDAVTLAMKGDLSAEEAFTSAAEAIRAAIAGQ
jgi:maltose-binding protein MalE